MFGLRSVFMAVLLSVLFAGSAQGDIKVVVSIKPIHALVAGVMAGAGAPSLIVDGAASPHTYSLKPSQAQALQDADVVFWVGHELEGFLEKPLDTLGGGAKTVALMDLPDLSRLAFRENGPSTSSDVAEKGHSHSHSHSHDHGEFDPHVWLDPENARVMVRGIAAALAGADPENSDIYAANAAMLSGRLDDLMSRMRARLEPVQARPFVVFHDSYQYLEARFGVSAVGSITVVPDVMPGAERVAEIQHRVRDLKAVCVFSEPQFTPKLVQVVAEGGVVKTGTLDPIGASLAAGPDLYFELMDNLTRDIADCLS